MSPEGAEKFDYPKALSRFGTEDILKEAVDAFLEESPQLEEKLRRCAHCNDLESLALTAHSIKGSLLMLEARESVRAAERLRCAAHQRDREASRTQLEALTAALNRLRRYLLDLRCQWA